MLRRLARPLVRHYAAWHTRRPHVYAPNGFAHLVMPGVFDPELTKVGAWLAGIVPGLAVRGESWVELGCGSGLVSVALAQAGALVTAIDLDPLACQNTKANTLLHNLSVRVEQGDLFAPVSGETFNAVIANLPFWPDAPGTLPLGHAFSAGPGYPLLRRFVAEAPQHAQRSYTVLSESFADFPAARTALGPSMRLLRREWFRGEWMNLFLLER